MKKLLLSLLFLLSVFPRLSADELAKPVRTIIRASRMLDVEAGMIVQNPVIVIANDRIESINPTEVPPDATVVDLKDVTLLPGLIDSHTHLTYDAGEWRLDLGNRPNAGAVGRALVGARNARITLMSGFTTVRDLGACCFSDVTLSRAIDKGIIDGPSVIPSANIISPTGGNCDQTISDTRILESGPEQGVADGPDMIQRAVRLQMKYGAKVIKVCADDEKFTEAELRIIADTAHQRKIKLAVHVDDTQSVLNALNGGADSIEHAAMFTEEVVDLMVKKDVYLVPTIFTIDPSEVKKFPPAILKEFGPLVPKYEEAFRLAVRKKVKLAFGSDTGQIAHGDNAKEFAAMVRYGVTPLQAIQSATVNAADLLDIKNDRGQLHAGLRADIIAVKGNPLEDVRVLEAPVFVMKEGKIYKQP